MVVNHYAEKIERLLAPLVGEFIAKMAVKSQCKSLGITPDDIGPHHLEDLSKKIGQALSFHGHREQAEKIVQMIKRL